VSAAPDRVSVWPLRFVDFDILGHVNNAVYWAIIEDEIAAQRERGRRMRAPLIVTLEHHDGIDREDSVEVTVRDTAAGFDLWVATTGGKVAGVARAMGIETVDALTSTGER
jgi:acyl-ACP thioesterase